MIRISSPENSTLYRSSTSPTGAGNAADTARADTNIDRSAFFSRERSALRGQDLRGRSFRLPDKQLVSDIDKIISFASDFRSKLNRLKDAAEAITVEGDSVFDEREVDVISPSVLSGRAEANALKRTYDVLAHELGSAQVDKTGELVADETIGETEELDISPGEYEIAIRQLIHEETFSLQVDEDDTVQEVLERLADEINELDMELKARVVERSDSDIDEDDTFVSLQVEAGRAGRVWAFDITEDSDTGTDLPNELGLETDVGATDGIVDIDDIDRFRHFSKGDDVFLLNDYGLKLELRDIGETGLQVLKDRDAIRDGIEEFIDAYDELITFVKRQETNGDLDRLQESLFNIAKEDEDALSDIGIYVDEEKDRIRVDREVLQQNIDDRVEFVEVILGDEGRIADRAADLSDRTLDMSPLRFMYEPREKEFHEFFDDAFDLRMYDRMGRSAYPTSMMQRGMLFEMVF